MNEEEKKAIEIIKKEITKPEKTPLEVYITDIKMLLHLILKLQKDNEKQSKVIDEMANIFLKTYRDWEVNRYIFQYHICSKLKKTKSEEKDCYADVRDEQSCRECIEQYFYRKVEENG